MIVRRIPKPTVQAMLSALRAANMTVTKKGGIYSAETADSKLVFRAMPGRADYLVRMVPDLFE